MRPLALAVAVACLAPLARADGPVDVHGRPLEDAAGRIHYRWTGSAWIARHADGELRHADGPPPAPAPGGIVPKSHSAYTLSPYETRAVGSWPSAVAIGDVTGDGWSDVVLVTASFADPVNDHSVFVFAQDPPGTLAAPVRHAYSAAANRNGIVLADLDEDGILDVVVGHGGGISVLLADGAGSLRPAVVVADGDADTLAAMDVDRDGHADVISLGWSRGASVFFGNGDGTFRSIEPLPTNASGYNDHEVADVSGDCFPDLAVMSGQLFATPNLSVHRHDGVSALSATPDTHDMGASDLTDGVGLGDVTGDGLNDAVLSRGANSPTWLWILPQDGTGALASPTTIASYDIPEPVEIADADGDRIEDVVVAHGGWNRVGTYLHDPAAGLEAEVLHPIPYASHYPPQGLAVGDFTGDRCPDVALADYNSGLVTLAGQGCFAPLPDADGDGVPDGEDNCPAIDNPFQQDADCDGTGDACEGSGSDRDGDTIDDAVDNCPDVPNDVQDDLDRDGLGDPCDPDRDGDGIDNGLDCRPDDPTPQGAPGEVDGLRVRKTAGGATLDVSWGDAGVAPGLNPRFDVAAHEIATLWANRDFAVATCLAPGLAARTLVDAPPASRWYLARAVSDCGTGSYGASAGPIDHRDALDDAATGPCP